MLLLLLRHFPELVACVSRTPPLPPARFFFTGDKQLTQVSKCVSYTYPLQHASRAPSSLRFCKIEKDRLILQRIWLPLIAIRTELVRYLKSYQYAGVEVED
jgi:hypothetical protein